MRVLLLSAGLSALPAAPVPAGAWQRGEGETFLSLTYGLATGDGMQDGTASIYLEHGLGWRLTAGMKLDQRVAGPHGLDFFLRRNLNAPDAALQVAVEAGLSFRIDGRLDELWRELRGEPAPIEDDPASYRDEIDLFPEFAGLLNPDLEFGTRYVVEPESDEPITVEPGRPTLAIHLGRGFGSPFSLGGWEAPGGWWDVRLGVDLPRDADEDPLGEIDATLGLSLGERTFLTFELWHDFDRRSSFTSVVPGVGLRFGDRYAATLRYVRDLDPGLPDSVEIGSWVEF